MVVINNPAAVFFDETPDPGVVDCLVVEDMVVLARVIRGLLLDEVAGTWILHEDETVAAVSVLFTEDFTVFANDEVGFT